MLTPTMETITELQENGYRHASFLPDGKVAGIQRMLFTFGLCCGIHREGNLLFHDYRYCYEHEADAIAALSEWDGKGDPPGPWIKLKGARVERLGPGALL